MQNLFTELLNFHINVQHGIFIDEIIKAPAQAGTLVFSHHETEPTWNNFYVNNLEQALRHAPLIAQHFAVRQRDVIWYLHEHLGAGLPPPWRTIGTDCWMLATPKCAPPTNSEFTARPLRTLADADVFNRIYCDAFWGGEPDEGAVLPAADLVASPRSFATRHWIGFVAETPVAIFSAISQNGLAAIYNVGTPAKFRGRGYGDAIMRTAMAGEMAQGVERFFLLTERNKSLSAFYERHGFAVVTHGTYYGRAGNNMAAT